jgi:CheR methyltransferase, all-alpha domain
MPRSAIAAGVVDFVLSPAAIAQEIARLARDPYVVDPGLAPLGAPDDVEPILALVHKQHGIDFGQYKSNTLHRRIKRRMTLLKIASLADYATRAARLPERLLMRAGGRRRRRGERRSRRRGASLGRVRATCGCGTCRGGR